MDLEVISTEFRFTDQMVTVLSLAVSTAGYLFVSSRTALINSVCSVRIRLVNFSFRIVL